jgi:hypothetical protein
MLNERGIADLANMGIWKCLIETLSDEDILEIENNSIYFNPLYSPASTSIINQNLPKNAKMITIDVNSLKDYTCEESVAVILHEIGHAVDSMRCDFTADKYVINHGYGQNLIDALVKSKTLKPVEFQKDITEQRICKIREFINNH